MSRASVHNLSIMKSLELGIGDNIQVYKANMIIPQIAENLTRSNSVKVPEHCPVWWGTYTDPGCERCGNPCVHKQRMPGQTDQIIYPVRQ